jgi:hypothetical protein
MSFHTAVDFFFFFFFFRRSGGNLGGMRLIGRNRGNWVISILIDELKRESVGEEEGN